MIREQFILLCKAQALITQAMGHSDGSQSLDIDKSVDIAADLLDEAIKGYARSLTEMSKDW